MNRLEQMRSDIATAVATITVTNGYRTTVKQTALTLLDWNSIGSLPAVSILFGDEMMTAQDTTRKTWDSDIDVILLGYCMRADKEALLHDLKRIGSKLSLLYMNQTNDRWFIAGQTPLMRANYQQMYSEERVFVGVTLSVRILAQDNMFTN